HIATAPRSARPSRHAAHPREGDDDAPQPPDPEGIYSPPDAQAASPAAARRAAAGHPRHHGREHRDAEPRARPEDQRRDDQLDDHGLLARLRQPAPARRPRRRPARPPPHVPDRPRRLHRLIARLRDGGVGGGAVRRPRRPGRRRRAAVSRRPLAHHQQLPRPGAREGARRLGCRRRRRRRTRRPPRRPAHPARRLAADLLRQPARRRRARLRRPQDRPRRQGEAALARPRRPRRRARHRQHAAVVYAITQADKAGWISTQTLGIGAAGIAGLAAFAVGERRTSQPLLRIERLRDRAVGGGLLLFLVNAGLMFGLFLLCSLYLQLALGHGPLTTGLAFIPLALAAGMGASAAGQLINKHGLRWVTGPALALAAGGLLLLSHVPAHGSYLRDLLPGMLMAGFGLGLSGTAMSVGVLTGARHDEAGMISGASATGHEIGGT